MPIGPVGLLQFYTGAESSVPTTRSPSFRSLKIAETGMSAQLLRMETAAANLANAETTRVGEAGSGPYQRKVVRLTESQEPNSPLSVPPLPPLLTEPRPLSQPDPIDPTFSLGGVEAAEITTDATPGPLVYDPGHPDADAQGYVRYPNVRVTDEITDLMDARRIYEANASVFQAAKLMLRRALDI
jgi:flagellar basal-body rod protein FlgC